MKSKTNVIFASVLKKERKKLGMTQEVLAFKANVSRAYISMLEIGLSSPSLDVILAISRGLQLPPSSFVKLIESAIEEEQADDW